jgi:PAS domain-containing protein
MPIVIVDAQGTLIYWNEPAEVLLGIRFEETGEIPASIWREQFAVRDVDQTPIPHDQWPLVIALIQHLPVSRTIWVGAPNGHWRHVNWTSVPFIAQGGEFLGVQSVFWEV